MKDNGGPAFPCRIPNETDRNIEVNGEIIPPGYVGHCKGMTLRDYFAGQALMGLMSACNSEGLWMAQGAENNAAKAAYVAADAMLAEREARK